LKIGPENNVQLNKSQNKFIHITEKKP